MIIKPSISFLNKNKDARLLTAAQTIITSMTGNLGYPSPSPTLTAVISATNDFADAMAAAANGGKTLTAAKNARRAALVALLRALANYVQVTCNGDLTVLLSSGFPIQKPQRNPIGTLPAPANLIVSVGSLSGELDASVSPVFGAATYNWRLAAASAPGVNLQTAQTTAGNNTFSGLTPGATYVIQVNAVGAAGVSDWSKSVSQMTM
jgi:hypothetical protein